MTKRNLPNRVTKGLNPKEKANSPKFLNDLAMLANDVVQRIRVKTKAGEELSQEDRKDLELCLAILKTSNEFMFKKRQLTAEMKARTEGEKLDETVSISDLKMALSRVSNG